jgi:hypothetical protein
MLLAKKEFIHTDTMSLDKTYTGLGFAEKLYYSDTDTLSPKKFGNVEKKL